MTDCARLAGALPRGSAWGVLLMVLAVGLGLLPGPAQAQKSKQLIRKEIERTERERASLKKKIDDQITSIAREEKRVAGEFSKAFGADEQRDLGERIAACVGKYVGAATNGNGHSPESIFDEFKSDLEGSLGKTVFEACQRQLVDMVAVLLENEDPPTGIRCARALNEALESELGSQFEKAWPKLRSHCRGAEELDDLMNKMRSLDREIEGLQLSLRSDIRGNVPRNMVAVAGVEGALIGITTKEIEQLSKDFQETVDRNEFVFLGSQTEKVTVPSFLIDQYEVTHVAYWYFCQQTKREKVPAYSAGADSRTDKKILKPLWPDGKIPEGWERRPITFVSLEDALEYAEWTGCRLPTEEEWEVAARSDRSGFDGRFWAWGNQYEKHRCNDEQAHDTVLRRKASTLIPRGVPLPAFLTVGDSSGGASPLGIYDLNGNAAEWTTSPFTPHSTFKEIDQDGVKILKSHFDEEQVAVRGGNCNQRPLIVSNVMRVGSNPSYGYQFVGFRRARSGTPGRDLLTRLMRHSRLDSRLQDFAKLSKLEKSEKAEFARIDTQEGAFDLLENLAWNDELGVPGEAKAILICNRLIDELSSDKDLKRFGDGNNEVQDACLIGMLHTDVAIIDPPLEPGTWFVAFKAGYDAKDPSTNKKVKEEDAFILVNLRSGIAPVVVPASDKDVVVVSKTETKLGATRNGETDGAAHDILDCVWSLDIKVRRKNSLQVILQLKLPKGALTDFL